MAGSGTDGSVAKPISESRELPDHPVQFFRLRAEQRAIQSRRLVVAKHRDDFIQREASHASERNQRQPT
jgi:hypothetical protein